MPLYHVGGVLRNLLAPLLRCNLPPSPAFSRLLSSSLRNLLAPLLSGGCVVCLPAFEPKLMWDVIVER